MTASGREAPSPGGLDDFARATVEALSLAPHPEGGWYRRTWQSALPWEGAAGPAPAARGGARAGEAPADDEMGERSTGARPLASLIYFLLPAGDASAWHQVDADELWLWHGPGPVTLQLGGKGERPVAGASHVLGPRPDGTLAGQLVVPAHAWQRTLPADEDALCSCVVSPGFVYAGFSLASGD